MDTARTGLFGFSHLQVTAGLSVVVLFGAIFWNVYAERQKTTFAVNAIATSSASGEDNLDTMFPNTPTETATSSPMTQFGTTILIQAINAYGGASKSGTSPEEGAAAVQNIGKKINPQVSYHVYAAGDIKTDTDSSPARVLAYRADLRTALEPLFENKEFELDIFAHYVDTGETKYLEQLHATANNYRAAVTNAANIIVPGDAASYHASILNSMGEFAATLDAMADSTSDPIASAALLKSYTNAEEGIVIAFNAIGAYAAQKTL